ncbi:protein kinase domain-containing protein [Brevibacillus laterosporus]|nr:protein kinase [Brevibacillus laterosporus]
MVQARKIRDTFSESLDRIALYEEYYADVENNHLRVIFSLLHAKINNLFEFLNHKNFPGNGGHYNAGQSRDLLDVIDTIQLLQSNLKNTSVGFRLDSYYLDLIGRCRTFLSKSGGSSIPERFPIIELIEHRAVFLLMDVTNIKRIQAKESFILKSIGSGSYGKVFKYKDSHYNRWFVLKRANKDLTPKELERFKNEYLETRKLDSPYIIEVYNYNDEKNEYTMEYANDGTLADYIRKNNTKISMSERINLILQLFRAFSYIHRKGLLHRDISFSNILVKHFDGEWTVIKVSDFGLVKIMESTLTSKDSSIKGSLNDPDLIKVGFNNYEVRHEIFALAQVVNFILCGKKYANGIYDNSQTVKEFILRGLAANINDRFASVDEMASAFNGVKKDLLN